MIPHERERERDKERVITCMRDSHKIVAREKEIVTTSAS